MDEMPPSIIIDDPAYIGSGKLKDKVAIITGGDSGIGAATAIAFAKEGAQIVIGYLESDEDASRVAEVVYSYGRDCICVRGDLGQKAKAEELVAKALKRFGRLDIVVNNAGTQVQQEHIQQITEQQLERTFRTNIFSMFFVVQAALPHMLKDSCIINTASVTAFRGSRELIDYSSTKGAIISFTRSLSQSLAEKPIRVNAVAPGPVWTPLILTSFDKEKLEGFGTHQPLGRAAQPIEIAPAYVFLASRDSRYITGQTIHVNGGEIVNA